MGDLSDLRSVMRARRRALDPRARQRAAESVVSAVTELDEFIAAETVAAYVAVDAEIDPSAILEVARATGRTPLVPVLGPEHTMTFAPVSPDTDYRENRYGIPEPVVSRGDHLPAMELDFVVVPTVAFDAGCRRVGSGGGYYDRAFAPLLWNRTPTGPILCGVAFELQRVGNLDPDPWDVTLDMIATEVSVIRRRA